ncbi:hypothetical protein TWF102_006246 [Orbilia oligospora]|uniref:Uncharacterized protein n=1 Tax=Orbilia oligospora TaxID=2813651 RepID=A0A7C8J6G9_ORBOL|nr:hypothetical protein TWF102_006246 [Orbilia oligospora]KAF3122324.1 hypothetical protein TWF594_002851 [Orbilia oligospora]
MSPSNSKTTAKQTTIVTPPKVSKEPVYNPREHKMTIPKSPYPQNHESPPKPSLCERFGSCIGRSCDKYIEYTGRNQSMRDQRF